MVGSHGALLLYTNIQELLFCGFKKNGKGYGCPNVTNYVAIAFMNNST